MASIVANCNYMINQSVFGLLAVMPYSIAGRDDD